MSRCSWCGRRRRDAVAGLTLADGALTVLWHSITWQYLSGEERAAIRARVDALGAQADARSPFAHLTLEPARPARHGADSAIRFLVRARSWPGGAAADPGRVPSARPAGELAIGVITKSFRVHRRPLLGPRESHRVVQHPGAIVQRLDGCHVLGFQREVEHVEVLRDALGL